MGSRQRAGGMIVFGKLARVQPITARQCHRLPICFLTSDLTNKKQEQELWLWDELACLIEGTVRGPPGLQNYVDNVIFFDKNDVVLEISDIDVWILGDIIFQTFEYHPRDRSLCIEGQANITALFSGCKYVDSIHLRSQKMRKSIKGRPNTALLFSDQSVTNSVWPLLMDIAMFPFI